MSRLACYRWLTLLFGLILLSSVALFLESKLFLGSSGLALALVTLYFQLTFLKCEKCGYSAGLSPAKWLGMDIYFFISESLLLGRCPKCRTSLKA